MRENKGEEDRDERLDRLEREILKLKRDNQKLKTDQKTSETTSNDINEISRRKFLKKLGAGALGLGALSLTPGSALNIKDDNLNIFTGDSTGTTEYFSVSQYGPVQIQNTHLDMNSQLIKNLSDPSNNQDAATKNYVDNNTGSTGIPSGIISMWSGTIAEIPSGWTLCDGTNPDGSDNAVPDLRNRFIVGAGGKYSVKETGGEREVQLTEGELPSYMADIPANDGGWSGGWAFETGNRSPGNAKSTELGGDDQPHENRPPYYALAYIMKL